MIGAYEKTVERRKRCCTSWQRFSNRALVLETVRTPEGGKEGRRLLPFKPGESYRTEWVSESVLQTKSEEEEDLQQQPALQKSSTSSSSKSERTLEDVLRRRERRNDAVCLWLTDWMTGSSVCCDTCRLIVVIENSSRGKYVYFRDNFCFRVSEKISIHQGLWFCKPVVVRVLLLLPRCREEREIYR